MDKFDFEAWFNNLSDEERNRFGTKEKAILQKLADNAFSAGVESTKPKGIEGYMWPKTK